MGQSFHLKIVVLGTEIKELEGEGDNWLEAVTETHDATLMTQGPSWDLGKSPAETRLPITWV